MFISSFKWRNKIQNIIKKEKKYDKSLYLFKNFGLGNFSEQSILGKFQENSDKDWDRILAPNRVHKTC